MFYLSNVLITGHLCHQHKNVGPKAYEVSLMHNLMMNWQTLNAPKKVTFLSSTEYWINPRPEGNWLGS